MAELHLRLSAIRDNLRVLVSECTKHSLEIVAVVKSCHYFRPMLEVFDLAKPNYLGVSKVSVASSFCTDLQTPFQLTSMPRPDQAREVVRFCASSLNSEICTVMALADAAELLESRHAFIVMIDVGDLREGILPEHAVSTVKEMIRRQGRYLKFDGIGTNYACANGVLPSADNLTTIYEIAGDLEREGIRVPKVSLGGSSILEWLIDTELPRVPTQVRVGQSVLLGTMPGKNLRHPLMRTDTAQFAATIVELKEKPSAPPVRTYPDAFGNPVESNNLGRRIRAILDFGVVDTDPKALVPREPGLTIITSNSDYTVADITECGRRLSVGDSVIFDLKYRAMLQSFMSPYLPKKIVDEIGFR